MARSRTIKPGIMTNEDLCELGPYAYILFTSLWMLADRAGRLEYRPKRIKAQAMPLWDEVTWETVENLVDKLMKSGFLRVYQVGANSYIQITTWSEHQHPSPREAESTIPPAPAVSAAESGSSTKALQLPCSGNATDMSSRVGLPLTFPGLPFVGERNDRVLTAKSPNGGKPTTTNPKRTQKPTHATPRKQPAREERASREGPHFEEGPRARAAPQGFAPEDVTVVRESLRDLAAQIGMPPPDDGVVRQVLAQAPGASGREIHEALVALWRRNKFRGMYSWGFVPLVVGQCFERVS
jgi:hypothetical protein